MADQRGVLVSQRAHQTRRVASDAAARTPGPEAVELINPNSVITVATAIGWRRRKKTRTNAVPPSTRSAATSQCAWRQAAGSGVRQTIREISTMAAKAFTKQGMKLKLQTQVT